MATSPISIPLRFQRAELEAKADLGPEGRAMLAEIGHPEKLVRALADGGHARDAIHALVLILPHRHAVWWGCMAARVLPGIEKRRSDLAALVAAERWVQSGAPADAEAAGAAAEAANRDLALAWVATAAFWSGPSIAPRGLQPVPPAPHLAGVATRIALQLLVIEPALQGRIAFADFLPLGMALLSGGNGAEVQAALRERVADLPQTRR
jgi:hypothetical protein